MLAHRDDLDRHSILHKSQIAFAKTYEAALPSGACPFGEGFGQRMNVAFATSEYSILSEDRWCELKCGIRHLNRPFGALQALVGAFP